MNPRFSLTPLGLAICLAFPVSSGFVFAAEPYPALPPSLSTSVTPNVLLYIDTSGSMLQDANNNWMLTGLCNSNNNWSGCVDNNTNNYRTSIDSEVTSPNTKMNIAKRVARNLIDANPNLRFGLFSFEDKPNNVGGAERSEGSVLRSPVMDMSVAANKSAMLTAINALNGRTATPLGEGLLEITQYLKGGASLYGKTAGLTGAVYTSPIQYRCQKNFAIVVTDGDATGEDNLPQVPYTARDGLGAAVAKNFNVCTNSNTVSNNDLDVNCPASLEGFTTTPGFGDGTNRFRALRDVAKYGRVADLRVGGNDLDGKSFDDPKFAKQNLTTYTIGFGVVNEVIPAAAKAGGGLSYTAQSEAALSNSLTAAVNSITASISNAGGVATQSETTQVGNKVFQPIYNPNGWYGELRCFALDTSTGVGAACTPNSKAVIPTPTATSGRNIYTSKVIPTASPLTDNETTAFDFKASNLSSMTSVQRSSLGSSSTIRRNNINFIRGVEGIAGFRSRYSAVAGATVLLGDIVDGQPIVVSKPFGATNDTSYSVFASDNASRSIVFVGANDGMLHAFAVNESSTGASDNMRELMGYIPSSVYPRLAALGAADYGAATPHTYHVNGNLKQADVKLSGSWKTIVVGGLGQGGQGYYAIDATTESQLDAATKAVKWEWTDAQSASMGYSFGTPIIYNVRESSTTVVPAVIVSNGYESDHDDTAAGGSKSTSKDSVLYILNANTGALIKSIPVPSGGGLSSPAGLDVGQDGILDYVYAGDLNGKLWRFDLTSDTPANFKVISTPIFDAGVGHPITLRPAVMPVNKSSDGTALGNLVLFGTGKLLIDSDRSDTTEQSLFGILDKMEAAPTTVPNTISATTLRDQTFTDTHTNSTADTIRDGSYRKVSNNAIDLTADANTYQGWVIRLPTSSERLVSTPLIFSDKVMFGTGIPISTEKCLPGGSGWILGLNPLTGSSVRKNNQSSGTEYSFIDINGDNKSTSADKIPFSSGSGYMSGYSKNGIPTEISYVSSTSALVGPSDTFSDTYGDAGSVIALREANSMGVYTGNGNVSRGRVIKHLESSGKGLSCGGTVGNDSLECEKLLGPPSGAANVSTTIWREIK